MTVQWISMAKIGHSHDKRWTVPTKKDWFPLQKRGIPIPNGKYMYNECLIIENKHMMTNKNRKTLANCNVNIYELMNAEITEIFLTKFNHVM